MNSRGSMGDKKQNSAFMLKEFQPAKPKLGYETTTVSPITSVIYTPSTVDEKDKTASEKNDSSKQTGLVHPDDYKRLKAGLELRSNRPISPTQDPAETEARRKKLEKLHKKRKSKLSFAFEEDGDDFSEGGTTSAYESSAKPSRSGSVLDNDEEPSTTSTKSSKRLKLGKDPTINTSFLPDREREEQERLEAEKKLEEWRKRQAEIKQETVEMQFAYYDGLSHLGNVSVKKGEAVFNLIDKAKKAFAAIRDIPADRLLFAKDDIIIPHEMSLYYFEANQVKGKYGLLFEFYDPVNPERQRNKNDPRLAKIVTRKYADNSKHIYPFARWELFDPEKDYTKKEEFKF